MSYSINFNEEKNQLLLATRGVSFEKVIELISENGLLADLAHPNKKYINQRLFVVEIDNYAYVVPYLINRQKREVFLKTIYASRVLTKKYLRKGRK